MYEELRSLFQLRPNVAFLNHGSFGACPTPVFERYQAWQREMESQPVEFHSRRAPELLRQARSVLAGNLNADVDDLVYVPNATYGVNVVARSLNLEPGDEILSTDHEYGACDRMWRFLCNKTGAVYNRVEIPVPVSDPQKIIDRLFDAVTPRTRVLFISHITSPTALTFPVAEACRRARELGLLSIIDGAHVPGQLPLDVAAVGADFYVGNLHKWVCAPKGAAFLHARPEQQSLLEPLIISWGWEPPVSRGSTFIDHLEYAGTSDISAPLTVPDALEFQKHHKWDRVRRSCRAMIDEARPEIARLLDAEPLAPQGEEWYMQMNAFLLPREIDGEQLQYRLYQDYLVEIPVFPWKDRQTLRISIQGYNNQHDVDRLLEGLKEVRNKVLRTTVEA